VIIKGKSRSGPRGLAAHLGNAEKNERVTLLETKFLLAKDLKGALIEMDAYAAGTRCERTMYHAAMSPEPPHRLTPEQRAEAVEILEAKLGFVGFSRVVVMHEKHGREHIHVVWSRIDLKTMKAVPDSHNYRKHEEVARDLERRFGHARVQGAHHERDGVARPERTPSRSELRQEERTGIKGKDVRAEVTAAFKASDSPEALKKALLEKGYILAQGDRRDFVVVDRAGGIHSLARRIEGMKAAALREFMAPVDREALPTIARAKEIAADLERKRQTGKTEKDYSRSEDYATQSRAALKDHQRRQKKINKDFSRDSAWDRIEIGERQRGKSEAAIDDHAPKANEAKSRKRDTEELTDAQRARLERLSNSESGGHERSDERSGDDLDRQREAPGGGRTRSR
jgi:hypothetical protein